MYIVNKLLPYVLQIILKELYFQKFLKSMISKKLKLTYYPQLIQIPLVNACLVSQADLKAWCYITISRYLVSLHPYQSIIKQLYAVPSVCSSVINIIIFNL